MKEEQLVYQLGGIEVGYCQAKSKKDKDVFILYHCGEVGERWRVADFRSKERALNYSQLEFLELQEV